MNHSFSVPKILICVLAMGSFALSRQAPVPALRTVQSDQPDPPGTCINNRFGSDCDLAQTGLLGHVKSVEDWLMRQGRKESFGHWIRNFSPDGHLMELGGREANGEIKISQWYSYDDKGRRVQVKVVDPNPKNNKIETRTYDSADRMTAYESQRGSGTRYRGEWKYNAAGLIETSDDLPDSHTEYRYDERNRLIAVTTTCARNPASYCGGQKVRYEYPSSDRKLTLDFSTCRKSEDAPDTPSMITDEISDSSGHLRSSTLTTTAQFASWPTACQSVSPGRHVYGYDSVGNRSVVLFYDSSGKIEWSEAITFDSHGKPLVDITTTPSSKSKQRSSVTRWTREYDSHGNVTLETYDSGPHETLHRIVTYYEN